MFFLRQSVWFPSPIAGQEGAYFTVPAAPDKVGCSSGSIDLDFVLLSISTTPASLIIGSGMTDLLIERDNFGVLLSTARTYHLAFSPFLRLTLKLQYATDCKVMLEIVIGRLNFRDSL